MDLSHCRLKTTNCKGHHGPSLKMTPESPPQNKTNTHQPSRQRLFWADGASLKTYRSEMRCGQRRDEVRKVCVFVFLCVCLRVTRVIGRGCLPRGDCWPHTQALPRQRCVVNNRRATTEGRPTQTQISVKVKDGCGCNGRALYRHVINTGGGREQRNSHVVSVDPDICISNAWQACMSIWFQPHRRVRWLPPHLLTLQTLTVHISCWPSGWRSGVIKIMIMWF